MILGKTNLSEWANFRSSHSTSGWSGRGGLTRNPYALDRNPCGSSSGTGAAHRSESRARAASAPRPMARSSARHRRTGWSASSRPSVWSAAPGIIPISHSQDTAGPMCRTVRDAAIMLGALTGVDPEDGYTRDSQGKSHADYTQFPRRERTEGRAHRRGAKVFRLQRRSRPDYERSYRVMKRRARRIVDPADIDTFGKFDETEIAGARLRAKGRHREISGRGSARRRPMKTLEGPD